jgi:hypothetical protein
MKTNFSISARFWSAPVLWRFGIARHALEKRQRTAAVQDAGARVAYFVEP